MAHIVQLVPKQKLFLFPQQEKLANDLINLLSIFTESEAKIRPHFHLTGPSGSGKSYLLKQICEAMKVPMIEVNAAGITAEGLSGNSLSKAIRKLREHWNEPNVIFVDEFDKLFQRNGSSTEDFRSGVQDEFLTCLESKYASVFTDYGKYEPTVIENSLFVFAGAYSNQRINTLKALRDAGMRTEFVGRVPLVFESLEVPLHELKKYIPEVALFKEYRKLFKEGRDSQHVAKIIQIMNEQDKESKIGIRLMNSAIHQHFLGQKDDH